MRCEVGLSSSHIITKIAYIGPYVEEGEDSGDEDSFHSRQDRTLWNPYDKENFKIISGTCSACKLNGTTVEDEEC